MRAVVQRVSQASVNVDNSDVGQINNGLLVLLGISNEDTDKDVDYILRKILGLRIFDDSEGIMNLSVKDIQGEILLVSQFTLYGDVRKGNRPSYIRAANSEISLPIYNSFIEKLKRENISFSTGEFGAEMTVSLKNEGPVTILLDSERNF